MEIRRLKIGEESEMVQLADKVFRDQHQKSMGLAFPTLYSPGVIEQSYGCFVEGKLVSFMGMAPATIRVGKAKLLVYSLGSVCTDPDFRGEGYASQILERIMADLQNTEASLMFVSGDRSLYTRVGCYFFGQAITFQIEEKTQENEEQDLVIAEAQAGDILSMARLAANREVAYEQTAHDIAFLIHSEAYASCVKRDHEVLVAKKQGKLSAFLVLALPYMKGANRDAIAIEWAGDDESVRALLQEALNHFDLKQVKIHVPWHEKKLQELLTGHQRQNRGNQGTVYVADPEKLLEQLAPYFEGKTTNQLNVVRTNDGISLTINGKTRNLSNEDFVSVLFDPDSDKLPTNQNLAIPLPYTVGLNYI